MATPSRFELPISSLTGRRVRPLHHGAAKANSRHHAMQTPRKQAATRVKDNAEWRPRQGGNLVFAGILQGIQCAEHG